MPFTRPSLQNQDQDQDQCYKTKTKTTARKTSAIQDQDQDRIRLVWDLSCNKTKVSEHITAMIHCQWQGISHIKSSKQLFASMSRQRSCMMVYISCYGCQYVSCSDKGLSAADPLSVQITSSRSHLATAVVAVDPSHMTTSSSASWSSFSPPSTFVSGHMSTMWFMVCHWPQSQPGDWTRPHLCRFARHGPWPVWTLLSRDHVWWRRSKPGCWTVWSVTIEWSLGQKSRTMHQSSYEYLHGKKLHDYLQNHLWLANGETKCGKVCA